MEIRGFIIEIAGIVQGVGFRPFVFKLAESMGLKGFVMNKGDRVEINVACTSLQLDDFINQIKADAPMMSEIFSIDVKETEYIGYKDFSIELSDPGIKTKVFISPDIAVCEDCRREMADSGDYRYRYPFISCTNCGPRFTIIKDVPYDRKNTTMEKFEMCDVCSRDYNDPKDRRYHAQPIACKKCGPRLIYFSSDMNKADLNKNKTDLVQNNADSLKYYEENALSEACRTISDGRIIAVKGLGGFHLACSAENSDAVSRLRKRKKRDGKPFAIMVKDTKTAAKYCEINDCEKKLLESTKSPIVLLKKRADCQFPSEIAEKNDYLGVMLPYTPLHILIFDKLSEQEHTIAALIMTSGNISDEPICYEDNEAVSRLGGIADGFLTNDRDIYTRTDDSVTRVFNDKEYIIRRSRGYIPVPINCEAATIGHTIVPSILACGAEQKNSFCINKNSEFYISHHIGDLENLETLNSFETGVSHFTKLFNISPDYVAFDMHPDYLSTKFAKDYGVSDDKLIPVQHHHAHIASCMADNNIDGEVIGVAFDGSGYGEDGAIWGGEFFTGGYKKFTRAGHLEYLEMPGGESAVREPWRMAESYLFKYNIKNSNNILKSISPEKREIVRHMLANKVNSPMTSSMGRLFDAVAAIAGFDGEIVCEGQAAIEFEFLANKEFDSSYEFEINDNENDIFEICVKDTIKGIMSDVGKNIPTEIISAKFHNTVAEIILKCCLKILNKSGLNRVVLGGGVFQNVTLLKKSIDKLKDKNFEVYIHSKIPTNDGGISLGQAVIALNKIQ